MRAAKSFTEILDLRGRIVLFTPTAAIGLRFEQQAERDHAQVIHTRGWADPIGPLHAWSRICACRDYGVLSCDQQRYITGFKLECTDLVWVGETGDPVNQAWLWARFSQAMNRGMDRENPPRLWMMAEGAV